MIRVVSMGIPIRVLSTGVSALVIGVLGIGAVFGICFLRDLLLERAECGVAGGVTEGLHSPLL